MMRMCYVAFRVLWLCAMAYDACLMFHGYRYMAHAPFFKLQASCVMLLVGRERYADAVHSFLELGKKPQHGSQWKAGGRPSREG